MPTPAAPSDAMRLDAVTQRHLELVETERARERAGSLLGTLDRTVTPMGRRMLRDWLLRPLVDPRKIAVRQQIVAELVEDGEELAFHTSPEIPLTGTRVALSDGVRRIDAWLYHQDESTGEVTRGLVPGALVVKAFNTIFYKRLAEEGKSKGAPGRLAIPVAGDDPGAKKVVMDLIDSIGFDPVDNGGLKEGGRKQQPGSPIYNNPIGAADMKDRLARI